MSKTSKLKDQYMKFAKANAQGVKAAAVADAAFAEAAKARDTLVSLTQKEEQAAKEPELREFWQLQHAAASELAKESSISGKEATGFAKSAERDYKAAEKAVAQRKADEKKAAEQAKKDEAAKKAAEKKAAADAKKAAAKTKAEPKAEQPKAEASTEAQVDLSEAIAAKTAAEQKAPILDI